MKNWFEYFKILYIWLNIENIQSPIYWFIQQVCAEHCFLLGIAMVWSGWDPQPATRGQGQVWLQEITIGNIISKSSPWNIALAWKQLFSNTLETENA